METELLKIFDDHRNQIGIAGREEVHIKGYWHETFQCWFVRKEEEANYIYLQLRSHLKKANPNLFDITAAGHLLASETIEEGVREIKEEIGVDISYNELIPLGIIESVMINGNSIDKEYAHVYLYETRQSIDDFTLQKEEVAGMVKITFKEFCELWSGRRETVKVSGYKVTSDGSKVPIEEEAGRDRFVPHPIRYYKTLNEKIEDLLRQPL